MLEICSIVTFSSNRRKKRHGGKDKNWQTKNSLILLIELRWCTKRGVAQWNKTMYWLLPRLDSFDPPIQSQLKLRGNFFKETQVIIANYKVGLIWCAVKKETQIQPFSLRVDKHIHFRIIDHQLCLLHVMEREDANDSYTEKNTWTWQQTRLKNKKNKNDGTKGIRRSDSMSSITTGSILPSRPPPSYSRIWLQRRRVGTSSRARPAISHSASACQNPPGVRCSLFPPTVW